MLALHLKQPNNISPAWFTSYKHNNISAACFTPYTAQQLLRFSLYILHSTTTSQIFDLHPTEHNNISAACFTSYTAQQHLSCLLYILHSTTTSQLLTLHASQHNNISGVRIHRIRTNNDGSRSKNIGILWIWTHNTGTKHQLPIEERESMLTETQNELLKNLQIYLQNICKNKHG